MDSKNTHQVDHTTQPQSNQPLTQKSSTDVLGILSIASPFVLPFLGALVGFILGLVGASKAKQEGRPTILSKVGWIMNLIFMILGIIGIVIIILLGVFASSASEDINNTARDVETRLEESTTKKQPNAKLVAAYDKVTEGMTKANAEAELGNASRCTKSSLSSGSTYEYCSYGGFSDRVLISVTYKDGAVQTKSKTEY